MPWLTIIMALLSFFVTKSKTGSTSKAALAAVAAGGLTYAYTHSNYAAGTSLAEYDGVSNAAVPVLNTDGSAAVDANGKAIKTSGPGVVDLAGKLVSSTEKVLTGWGATGTSAVLATGAVVSSSSLQKYLPWLIGAGLVFLVAR